MSRTTGKTAQGRHEVKKVSAKQRRKSIKRSQLKIKKGTLEIRRAVSQRARTHPMEAAGIGQPQTPQSVLQESTAIRRLKYWIKDKRLRIWFTTNHIYDYYDVPESIVHTLSQAQSKGRTFNETIQEWIGTKPHKELRVNYDYKRIR